MDQLVNAAQAIRRSSYGANVLPRSEGVNFRLWAPAHSNVRLEIVGEDASHEANVSEDGWHEVTVSTAAHGSKYWYVLPDGSRVPDPASSYQPDDVLGPSEVVDQATFNWTDGGWKGRPWTESVVYELHVGAFTPEGTFSSAREKLAHLAALGITAIELMPLGDFAGARNWGYDGVFPYAPDASYGRPEELKAFVDAAHSLRISVFLDVVYNHFGPHGNFLSSYAPHFFTDRHKTPWGAGINFDGQHSAPVRAFFVENALYWLEHFHIDGLRLDAVHTIMDDSSCHLLEEIAGRVKRWAGDRQIHLILENEENEATRLRRDARNLPIEYTAQWNDDVHHVLHTAATAETSGYYADYCGNIERLVRALAEGFAFQGEVMEFRGSRRGEPSAELPPSAFVAFIQNHDQIGNRAFGDRLGAVAEPAALRAIAATYLLLPQVPMLFMGEEWGTNKPFPFFCDFEGELADAIRVGRRNEFAKFPEFHDPENRERIPDPLSVTTFESAKLDWDAAGASSHAEILRWYQAILRTRHLELLPRLASIGGHSATSQVLGTSVIRIEWKVGASETLELLANLTARDAPIDVRPTGRILWQEGGWDGRGALSPWSVFWSLKQS